MGRYQIDDIDGNVLYRGSARNKRSLFADLVKQGKSFARADLSKMNLSGLEMHRIDAPGASFAGADMRGVQMLEAFAPGSDFSGCLMAGSNLEKGNFEACDFTKADMSSVKSKCAKYRGSRFARTNFFSALLSSSIMSHCSVVSCDLTDADMSNVDMSLGEFVRCDFSGARFSPRMLKSGGVGTLSDERAAELPDHFPNRTHGTKVSACKYTKATVLHDTVPALRSDRRIGRAAKFLLWTASTAGVVFGGESAIEALKDTGIPEHLGSNYGIIGVLGAAYFTKDVIAEYARDFIEDKLISAVHAVESAVLELNRTRSRHSGLVAMVGRKLSLDPLHLALSARVPEARSKGLSGAFRAFATDIGHVIVCDRAHLALAMAALSSNRGQTFPIPHDIILMRSDCDHPPGMSAPCAVSFLKDGRTTAVWACGGGRHATTVYDRAGALVSSYGADGKPATREELGLPAAASCRLDAYMEYESAILAQHGLHGFSYDRGSHFVQAGADGSILVQSHKDHRVDNRHGSPAVLRPDGTGIMVTNGQITGEWERPPRRQDGRVPAAGVHVPAM